MKTGPDSAIQSVKPNAAGQFQPSPLHAGLSSYRIHGVQIGTAISRDKGRGGEEAQVCAGADRWQKPRQPQEPGCLSPQAPFQERRCELLG